jgi:predicted small secreted protein
MLKHVRVAALLLAAALAACDTTQPAGEIRTGGPLLDIYDPPIVVDVLQRTTPLSRDYTASAVITRSGGTISIPEAGFSITFPSNSLRGTPTLITVTAMAGGDVAYRFEPHGLVFHNAPMITQDLRGTQVFQNPELRSALEGAYFPDDTYLGGDGTAKIKETRPTVVDVNGWKMKFNVQHFSGYLAAAGRSGYISSSGNLIPFGN